MVEQVPRGNQRVSQVGNTGEESFETWEKIVVQPVDVLRKLVREKKIDPWNIDIVKVADHFIAELKKCRELNLRISARTLLWASVLVNIKSGLLVAREELETTEDVDVDDWEEWEELEELVEECSIVSDESLDVEEFNQQPAQAITASGVFFSESGRRKRVLTLNQLVAMLEKAIQKGKRKSVRTKLEEPETLLSFDPYQVALENQIDKTYNHILKLARTRSSVMFTNLIEKGTRNEIAVLFLSILILAERGVVTLHQEKEFGDIVIRVVKGDDGGPKG